MSSRPLLCSSLHPRWLPLAAACLLGASSASAALITVSGTFTATSSAATSAAGPSIVAGDIFDYSFTFDDATADTNSNTYNAQFGHGVSAVSLQARGTNVGTWTPAGGTFYSTPNFSVNANGESITLQAQGTGFLPINGFAFHDFSLSFNWSGARNFVDNGSGETFAQVVGVSPLNFATAPLVSAEIRGMNSVTGNYDSPPSFSMTVNGAGGGASVPEGSVLAPLALGLGALLAGRGRRR